MVDLVQTVPVQTPTGTYNMPVGSDTLTELVKVKRLAGLSHANIFLGEVQITRIEDLPSAVMAGQEYHLEPYDAPGR